MNTAPDHFRKQYRKLTEAELEAIYEVKVDAEVLLTCIMRLPESRERALAATKLEECVMWAVKALTG